MKISYRTTNFIVFILYLLPILIMGYFVNQRINQRQITLQAFLQNQIEMDRKIVIEREKLRVNLLAIGVAVDDPANQNKLDEAKSTIKDLQADYKNFWQKYENSYSASQRPLLKSILEDTQELNLIEDELRAVRNVSRQTDSFIVFIGSYLDQNYANRANTNSATAVLNESNKRIINIARAIDDLTDIRYIFSQRIVFFVAGENAKAQGEFDSIFMSLALIILIITITEYFFIRRPLGDIMLFLSDLSQGKRGQRLYFSSPIKEIKQSEEIINKFVEKAETHEGEK